MFQNPTGSLVKARRRSRMCYDFFTLNRTLTVSGFGLEDRARPVTNRTAAGATQL